MIPVVDRAGDYVIVPCLVLIGSISVLVMTKRSAAWFAFWCWLLCAVTVPWALVEPTALEVVLSTVMLAVVQLAGWKFVSLAADLLLREEHSHRAALEANRRLLEFEHALALCSRALLIASGEEALEEALATLREAIGADRAYLAMNVEKPDLGPSFLVVKSATRPGCEEDEWVGEPRPGRSTRWWRMSSQPAGRSGTWPPMTPGRDGTAPSSACPSSSKGAGSPRSDSSTSPDRPCGTTRRSRCCRWPRRCWALSGSERPPGRGSKTSSSPRIVSWPVSPTSCESQAETVLASIGSTGGKSIQVVGGRGNVWADPSRTRQIIRNLTLPTAGLSATKMDDGAVENPAVVATAR